MWRPWDIISSVALKNFTSLISRSSAFTCISIMPNIPFRAYGYLWAFLTTSFDTNLLVVDSSDVACAKTVPVIDCFGLNSCKSWWAFIVSLSKSLISSSCDSISGEKDSLNLSMLGTFVAPISAASQSMYM